MWISFLVNIKRPNRNVQKTLPGRHTHIPFKQGRANAFERQLLFVRQPLEIEEEPITACVTTWPQQPLV